MNRNVLLNLLASSIGGVGDSIWSQTILVYFLKQLTGSNTKVGITTAIQGGSQLLTAFPAGWAADRWSRSPIIAIGGVAMLLSIAAVAYGVVVSAWDTGSTSFALLCIGLALNGLAGGINNGPAQALLADSLTTGLRDEYYNYIFIAYMGGSMAGPLLCVILFTYWDGYSSHTERWPMDKLRWVILIGLALEIPVAIIMFLFRDSEALGDKSRGIAEAEPTAQQAAKEGQDTMYESLIAPGDVKGEDGQDLGKSDRDDEEAEEEAAWEEWMQEASRMTGFGGLLTVHHIPYVLFACDVTISLASGMTIKFFPLFFGEPASKGGCDMSLAEVQTVYLVVPLCMCVASTLGTRLAKLTGRVQAVLILRALGLSCFGAMILAFKYHLSFVYVIAAYVARTSLMNCTYPIENGILMDYVPKRHRARWKSLESVSIFGWCGSAFIGGVLADKKGYTFTFMLTLGLQAFSTLIYSSLTTVVSSKRPQDVLAERKERREAMLATSVG